MVHRYLRPQYLHPRPIEAKNRQAARNIHDCPINEPVAQLMRHVRRIQLATYRVQNRLELGPSPGRRVRASPETRPRGPGKRLVDNRLAATYGELQLRSPSPLVFHLSMSAGKEGAKLALEECGGFGQRIWPTCPFSTWWPSAQRLNAMGMAWSAVNASESVVHVRGHCPTSLLKAAPKGRSSRRPTGLRSPPKWRSMVLGKHQIRSQTGRE